MVDNKDKQTPEEKPVKKKPKDCIEVPLKDLVEGKSSLIELSEMDITESVSYWISKWMRKILPEIELYSKGITSIMMKHGAEPGEKGILKIAIESEEFKPAQKEMDEYQDEILKENIYFERLKPIKLHDLMEALPKQKPSKEGEETKPRIKPYILADLWFMIEE